MNPVTSHSLKALEARRRKLLREIDEIDLFKQIVIADRECILPIPLDDLPHEDSLEKISSATSFWTEGGTERLEFLLRMVLASAEEKKVFDTLLRAWISLLSRRQTRLTKRLSRKGGDAGAYALRRASRPVISRLIEIRRETKRVSRLAADIRNS